MDIPILLQKLGVPFELIAIVCVFILAMKVYFSIQNFISDQKTEFREFKKDVTAKLENHAAILNQLIGRNQVNKGD
jgi:hypothetical protein